MRLSAPPSRPTVAAAAAATALRAPTGPGGRSRRCTGTRRSRGSRSDRGTGRQSDRRACGRSGRRSRPHQPPRRSGSGRAPGARWSRPAAGRASPSRVVALRPCIVQFAASQQLGAVALDHDALVAQDADPTSPEHRDERLPLGAEVVVIAHRHEDALRGAQGADDIGHVFVEVATPFFTCTGLAVAIAGFALAKSEPAGHIQSLSHAIHAVNDLDTTLAFYNDVFGLPGKPQDFPNPAVPLLTNAPGVTLRLSMLPLPGKMRFELTHFKGLERKPAQAKYTDPGAASIVFHVRDIDTVVANAKKANAPVVTTGGVPVEITTAAGKARSIIIRDPDGFFVQSIQDAPAAGRARRECSSRVARLHHGKRGKHDEVLQRHDGRRTFSAIRIFERSGSA